MNVLRVLIIVGVLWGGLQYWNRHEAAVALAAATDDNGFVDVPPVEGQNSDTIYVVAALNCPHEDAQRADRLAEQLRDKGISVIRTDSVNYHWSDADSSGAVIDRVNTVMNGPLPLVFVRGRVRPAATLDQVMAELAAPAKAAPASSP